MNTDTTGTEVIEAEVVDDTEAAVEEQVEHLLPVAVTQTPHPVELDTIPGQDEFRAIAQMALLLSQANLVPAPLRKKPHDVFLVLLTGRDLGVPLTTALREAYVIDGKVTVAPALRLAKVRQMGLGRVVPHPESDLNNYGALAVDPNNQPLGPPIWFGWADAQNAGLVDDDCYVDESGRKVVHADRDANPADRRDKGEKCRCKDNWRKYPQRMLWWRAAGYCADDYFPEAGLGIYSPDEMGAVTDAEGRPVDVTGVELPAGWDKPGQKDEPPASEDDIARLQRAIGVLTDDEKVRLRAMWSERELPALGKILAKHVIIIEAMIGAVAKSAVTSERGQGEGPEVGSVPTGESPPPEPDDGTHGGEPKPVTAEDAADAEWTAKAQGVERDPQEDAPA